MITEDYVSLEISKLLKKKGFNEGCRQYWYRDNLIFARGEIWNSELDNYEEEGWTAPTLQMAMKWLREVHGIDISIDIRFWTEDEDVYVKSWKYTVYHKDEIEDFGQSDTYEEACEAAIKYCLENLI